MVSRRVFIRKISSVTKTLATTATVLIARGPVPQLVPLVTAGCYLVAILIIRAETAKALRD